MLAKLVAAMDRERFESIVVSMITSSGALQPYCLIVGVGSDA